MLSFLKMDCVVFTTRTRRNLLIYVIFNNLFYIIYNMHSVCKTQSLKLLVDLLVATGEFSL